MHEPREERESRFVGTVSKTVKKGGRCLIPVFALGRAQELLLILDEYWQVRCPCAVLRLVGLVVVVVVALLWPLRGKLVDAAVPQLILYKQGLTMCAWTLLNQFAIGYGDETVLLCCSVATRGVG